jgi:hypothetical protein
LFTSWLDLLVFNTAREECWAILVSHVLIDEEGKDLTVFHTHISNIFVVRIEVAILYL